MTAENSILLGFDAQVGDHVRKSEGGSLGIVTSVVDDLLDLVRVRWRVAVFTTESRRNLIEVDQ